MEIEQIRGTSWIRVFLQSFRIFHFRLALFISILSYVLLGNNINTKQVNMCINYKFKKLNIKSMALYLFSLGCGLEQILLVYGIWFFQNLI